MSTTRPHRRLTLTRATAPEVTETAIVSVEPPAHARRPAMFRGASIGELLARLQAVEAISEELERRLREPVRPDRPRPVDAAPSTAPAAKPEPALDPDFAMRARRAIQAALARESHGFQLGAALFLPAFLLAAGLAWITPRYFVAHAREASPASRARTGLGGFLEPAAAMAGEPAAREPAAAGRARSSRGTADGDVERLVSNLKRGDQFDFPLEKLVR